jgi:hypothetical protein
MSTMISYEDVQTAANQIAQCTSNVLTVTGFPLDDRGIGFCDKIICNKIRLYRS